VLRRNWSRNEAPGGLEPHTAVVEADSASTLAVLRYGTGAVGSGFRSTSIAQSDTSATIAPIAASAGANAAPTPPKVSGNSAIVRPSCLSMPACSISCSGGSKLGPPETTLTISWLAVRDRVLISIG
jgi:hypothetical protein